MPPEKAHKLFEQMHHGADVPEDAERVERKARESEAAELSVRMPQPEGQTSPQPIGDNPKKATRKMTEGIAFKEKPDLDYWRQWEQEHDQ